MTVNKPKTPKETTEDDSFSVSSDNDMTYSTTQEESERDEVKEVQKMSQADTNRVQRWRIMTTFVLMLTAFAVTYTTYRFLKNEETKNFETAFEKFSRTLGDAAVAQQVDLRQGLRTLATICSVYAYSNNLTWPFVTVPQFEQFGANYLKQSHTEVVSLFMMVKNETKEDYLNYTTANRKIWVEESHYTQKGSLERLIDPASNFTYHPFITRASPKGFIEDIDRELYWPSWQYSPPPSSYGLINWNPQSTPDYDALIDGMVALKSETLVSKVRKYVGVPTAMSEEEHAALHSKLADSSAEHPHSFAFHPVHKNTSDYDSEIVGMLASATAWDEALLRLLPEGVLGIHTVIKNNCNQSYTYEIVGHDAFFKGAEDLHEEKYSSFEVMVNLALHSNPDFNSTPGHCQYSMHIYPTQAFKEQYDSNTPEIFAAVVFGTFILVAIVFFVYDVTVQTRNINLVHKAAQSNALVTSLFPDHIRDRLKDEQEQAQQQKKKGNLKAFLNDGKDANFVADMHERMLSKPMADLYLDTSVIFADISGFTAWSSVREPFQVFTLLETTYQAFDLIAKKHRVFKVETVGDCYVAVCGLPNPRVDHAVCMARFARDIMSKHRIMVKELEVTLGPDTGDLSLRVGIHSGPVTAGVLRGERARFQLFGDTMNTCARVESTGVAGRIQCSKETAELLKAAGKEGWLEKRVEPVAAKGKGKLELYWLAVAGERAGSTASSSHFMDASMAVKTASHGPRVVPGLSQRTYRLIDWNVENLVRILKEIVAQRGSKSSQAVAKASSTGACNVGETPLEEVREIIALPDFCSKTACNQIDPTTVEIPQNVVQQLHGLVSNIAAMYNNNPFHNFDHASHVVMSVTKLLSRIVAPAHMDDISGDNAAASLHDHTYGITSDPLTHFACAFSALIHDVDHVGVSNAQLVKEQVPIAVRYKERSVAEQNSLDLSWDLLMQPTYGDLRAYLFPSQGELTRFRQLVVNCVMSTDIVDKEMKALRNGRWDKAFKKGDNVDFVDASKKDEVNRKATIVIEHIIQASDISHTMQHWHVYRKWNQNLFEELYVAFLNGRMEKDPATFWYKGEFGFFDFYIIPLTQKLKDCGVFGVSSGEFLDFAKKNRAEWEAHGEEAVAEMIEEAKEKYGVPGALKPAALQTKQQVQPKRTSFVGSAGL